MATHTAAGIVADLSGKLEGCRVGWESTGGACYGIVAVADVRWQPRRHVLITEADDTYPDATIPPHRWNTYTVGYYDNDADQAPCQPQIGWEEHGDAGRLASDIARWLLDAEMPTSATRF